MANYNIEGEINMTNKELAKQVKEILRRLEELEARKVELADEFYSVKQFAKMMHVSVATAYNILNRNQIETVKLGTTKVRASDIEKLIGRISNA